MTIYIDFETRSKVDIRKVGAWRYAEDPSTEILCMAYAYDNHPVQLWMPGQQALLEDFSESDYHIEAHNAFFERAIWYNIMHKRFGYADIPHNQWRCSAALISYYALPRSLKNAGAALRLNTVKDDEGNRIMMSLCKPRKPRKPSKDNQDEWMTKEKYPERYKKLYEYCKQDVEAERAISKALPSLPPQEIDIWLMDQKINQRGVAIDVEAVQTIVGIVNRHTEILKEKVKKITNGIGINQVAKMIEWANYENVKLKGYDKQNITEAIEILTMLGGSDHVLEVLKIRQELGKTSTAKYDKMLQSVSEDGRIRDTLKYFGASTGRWSGKLVQFQNLPRGDIKDMDAAVEDIKNKPTPVGELGLMGKLSSMVRGMVIAPQGKQLMVADFSSIEARVLAWLANCDIALTQFKNKEDLYVSMAAIIYRKDIGDVTKEERHLGKTAVLGCGFGMGKVKFQETCKAQGLIIGEELAERAVNAYRRIYEDIKFYWYETERTVKLAIKTGKPESLYGTTWFMNKSFLHCKLPSGRCISYKEPKITPKETPWGTPTEEISYMAVVNGKWFRESTYGGKLVENVTQAVARDIMAEAMLRIEAEDEFNIVLSIHDEVIAEAPIGASFDKFKSLLTKQPKWSDGLPIEADGWVGKRYRK